MIRAATGSV